MQNSQHRVGSTNPASVWEKCFVLCP
jgi:hypothetical protein